jgi:peptidoglycan/xylan/chitin deacetylase (PgdA/CDA1 family)
VDGQCWLWWDALRYLLNAQPDGPLYLELPDQTFNFDLGDQVSRDAAWSNIADHLVTRNDARSLALAQLEMAAGIALPASPSAEYAPMSWKQLRQCSAAGIEVGGHTMTHAFLPALNRQELRHELYDAKVLLERQLIQPVTTLAYPNGMPYDWTPEVEQAARDIGFKLAVLAHPRRFDPEDRYRLGRWPTDPHDPRFDHILNGASVLKLSLLGASTDPGN